MSAYNEKQTTQDGLMDEVFADGWLQEVRDKEQLTTEQEAKVIASVIQLTGWEEDRLEGDKK